MKKKIKFILIGFLSLTTFSTITTTSTSCSKYTNPFETLVPGTNFTISENQIDEFRKASYNMFFGTAPFSIANPFDELCSGASTQADSTNDSICAYWELTYALIDTMKENSLVRIDFVFATSIKWFTVASTTELQCSAWTITGVNTQGETYTIVNSTSLISYISYESNTEYIFKISGEQPLFTLTPPSQYLRHIKSE